MPTGVEYCLFDQRYFQNLDVDERKLLHTFFFIEMPYWGSRGAKCPNKMKNEKYMTPEIEELEVVVEQGFATSPGDGGSEGTGDEDLMF